MTIPYKVKSFYSDELCLGLLSFASIFAQWELFVRQMKERPCCRIVNDNMNTDIVCKENQISHIHLIVCHYGNPPHMSKIT